MYVETAHSINPPFTISLVWSEINETTSALIALSDARR
jgi:hypothetical protein